MTLDKGKDEEAIRQWHQEVENASNSADFDAYASHWSDDMIWMPPNMQPIQGKKTCMARACFEKSPLIIPIKMHRIVRVTSKSVFISHPIKKDTRT